MSFMHRLEGASVIRVQPRGDRVLTACEGRLWVTVAGVRAADHVLKAGDRMLLRAGEVAVISSGPRGRHSTFSVEAHAPARPRRAATRGWLHALMMGVPGPRFAR
ncbi:MAG: DUF2917 domain-containing protein [Burkholderiales bacterium]|nr:DUF2917 domain-containing protein [Burkholderiales bacterium]